MSNEAIRTKYSPRQYFQKLVKDGTDPALASSIVNGIFG